MPPKKLPDKLKGIFSGKKIKEFFNSLTGKISQSLPKGIPKDVGKDLGKDFSKKVPDIPDPEQSKKLIQKFIREYFGKISRKGTVFFEGDRPMKYPYTLTAKLMQFPYMFYIQKQWIYRYYVIALAVCVPIFKSISNLSNSPGNVAKWREIKRKEAEEAKHHH